MTESESARPLEGARILLLTSDPFSIEEIAAALEDEGAELRIPFEEPSWDQVRDSDLVLVEERYRAQGGAAIALLDRARSEGIRTLDLEDSAEPGAIIASAAAAIAATLPDRPAETDVANTAVSAEQVPAEALPEDALLETEAATAAESEAALETVPETAPLWDTQRLVRAIATVLIVVIVLILLSRAGPLADQRESPAPQVNTLEQGVPGAQTAATAELAGRVTRSDTQGSVGGATVVVSGPSGPMATITDAQGRWRFTGLRGGSYVVMSTVPRFVAKQVQVEVAEGKAVENVHLSLDPEGP